MNDLPWLLRAAALALFVLAYYRYAKAILFVGCRRLAHALPFARQWSASERSGVLELGAAGTSHVLVIGVLVVATGVGLSGLNLGFDRPALIVLGVLIGIGEMALASLICRVIMEAFLVRGNDKTASRNSRAADSDRHAERSRQWLGLSRGGWIRHHLKTMEALSWPLALVLTTVQVGSEEIVFRGIMLGYLRDAGIFAALGTSFVLFVAMQVFLMSTWRAAMFPVVGAIVMGLVHGLLFWNYPVLLPLVVAHVSFFVFAVG
jgi:hypothetical protein